VNSRFRNWAVQGAYRYAQSSVGVQSSVGDAVVALGMPGYAWRIICSSRFLGIFSFSSLSLGVLQQKQNIVPLSSDNGTRSMLCFVSKKEMK
jgi:hypothetical protein